MSTENRTLSFNSNPQSDPQSLYYTIGTRASDAEYMDMEAALRRSIEEDLKHIQTCEFLSMLKAFITFIIMFDKSRNATDNEKESAERLYTKCFEKAVMFCNGEIFEKACKQVKDDLQNQCAFNVSSLPQTAP